MKSRFQFPLAAKLGLAVIAAQSLALLALGSLHLRLHAAETPETLRALWLWIASGFLAAILVTALVLWWMTRRLVTARIGSVAGAVRRLAGGELGARLPAADEADEIGRLGSDFNAMAERLGAARRLGGGSMPFRSRSITPASNVVSWAQGVLADPATIFLDTETTGLDAYAELVDIAVVDAAGRVLLDSLVRPRRPIPADCG